LSDADMSETDFKSNLAAIHKVMSTRSILWFFLINTENFAKSISAQLNSDLGWNPDVYWNIKIEKVDVDVLNLRANCTFHSDANPAAFREVSTVLRYRATGEHVLAKFVYSRHPDGFLPMSSGTLSGNLNIKKTTGDAGVTFVREETNGQAWAIITSNAYQMAVRKTYGDATNERRLYIYSHAGQTNPINAIRFYDVTDGSGVLYNLFGDHNKPKGSYTGNGGSASRTISTGGIGSAIAIWSDNGLAIVTPAGAVKKTVTGTSASGVAQSGCTFENGVLTIASTDTCLNASGITYNYQVL